MSGCERECAVDFYQSISLLCELSHVNHNRLSVCVCLSCCAPSRTAAAALIEGSTCDVVLTSVGDLRIMNLVFLAYILDVVISNQWTMVTPPLSGY